MIITPNFHFDGKCEQAIELYKQAFCSKVTCLLRYKDANKEDSGSIDSKYLDYIYHAEMMLGTTRIFLSDTFDEVSDICNKNMLSLVITFDCADDVKNAYSAMLEGSTIVHPIQNKTYSSCFVSLIDKFGVRWELMTEQTEK